MLKYDKNSNKLSFTDEVAETASKDLKVNLKQVNRLTESLIAESNPNFTPQPSPEAANMVKKLYEASLQQAQKQKLQEALRNINLSLEMRSKAHHPWEAFAFQLQELQMILRSITDFEISAERYIDALQHLEMLLSCGLVIPDLFIRMTEVLLKLRRYEEAKAACERGLALDSSNLRLKALLLESNRMLADYNGEI
ncbi:HHR123Cp [Eremothecium sinecaudum]|uniref:HHR123Cp n=1 Tax=Eremothecium sinecaudum TaxID=45286 RepID=A0A120K2X4_9SACH|nr:HHR123Cp [Eremothecium sinecaudum]AMD22892.1 HHR123Cp [Eremothecium sinecaudum]